MHYSIDLDAGLLERLRDEARKRDRSVAELISLLLSRSLADIERVAPARPHFTVKAKALHAFPGIDFSSTSHLLDSLDEERYPG